MDTQAPFIDEAEEDSFVFVIEKDVPMPPGRARYRFEDMDIGDSFGLPASRVKLIRSAAQAYAKRHSGYDFELRQMRDQTWRCWRTA